MRHPALRLFQAVCAIGLTAATALARPAPPPLDKPVWISVLGELERPDGSWQGTDLLDIGGETRIDRFQVTVRPESPVRLRLEAVTAEGVQVLYPAHSGSSPLEPGRAYSLPGPRAFFELRGEAQLRVVVSRAGSAPMADGESVLRATSESHSVRYPLSDGASARVHERAFRPEHGREGVLSLALPGR
ncbi:MAG: hypothetical protein HY901_09405 [Deltaproteobacteria bacterium]|nr:hypothetical protein [Deltaproteobacteria bacterium]